jgi:phage I-like protein
MSYEPFSTSIDLSDVQLAEGDLTWLHTMNFGTYQHPKWGSIEFNAERLQRFAQNVKNKVRGIDLDIDYDHKEDPAKGKMAAGWIKDAEVRGNGLWIAVEWTPEGWKSVQDKEYRYLSPEYQDEWKHNGTGETHRDVLFGAALTNRPFLKDLLPITMAEIRTDLEVSLEERISAVERLMEKLYLHVVRGGK